MDVEGCHSSNMCHDTSLSFIPRLHVHHFLDVDVGVSGHEYKKGVDNRFVVSG